MDNTENLEKSSIFKRVSNLFEITFESAWENLIIVVIGALICTFLAEYCGIINFMIGIDGVLDDQTSLIGGCFFIILGIVELYIIQRLPLKVMRKNVIIYALIVALALATGLICYWSLTFAIITIALWIFLYIYLQMINNSLSITGLFGLLIFILVSTAAPTWGWIEFPLETIALYAVFGFSMVLICSIPMFIIRILQKDPAKRELIARLFNKDIQFHDFVKTKDEIITFDNSMRIRSIISIAKDFYIANSNLQTLSKYMEDDEDYQVFIDEIERLLNKVKIAILKGFDEGFEVNLGYIAEYQKTLEFKLSQIPDKNSDVLLLDITIKNYKTMFEDLNAILNDEKYVDNIAPHKRHNNLLEVIKGFNLSNINLRYSVRSIVAILLSFIVDVTFIHSPLKLTTLISAFTIKPSSSNTNKDILIRFIATIAGIVIGIILSSILKYFELFYILAIADIICFLLFFVFKENEQLSLIFIMMAFMFLNYTESIAVSVEHLIITIVSMLIIIFISNFVLPSDENSNIIELFNKKLDLIIKFNQKTLINNKDNTEIIVELSNNNYEIMRLFSKLNDTYSNICKDIRTLSELNSTFEDYINTILSIKKFSKDCDYEFFGKSMNSIFESIKLRFNGEELPDNMINKDLQIFLAEIAEDEEISFLLPSFQNIVKDIIYMHDLMIEGERANIFEIYDQDILEDNIKDKITWKNFKYLLNHYRYIFVAASYIYNISGEDIKNVAKTGVDHVQNTYDHSIKYAYDVAQDEIKNVYESSTKNINEIKEYGKANIKLLQKTGHIIVDESGNLIKTLYDESGNIVKTLYDESGNVVKTIYVESENMAKIFYDESGNKVRNLYDESGYIAKIFYDESGNMIKTLYDNSGNVFRTLYSETGNIAKNIYEISTEQMNHLYDEASGTYAKDTTFYNIYNIGKKHSINTVKTIENSGKFIINESGEIVNMANAQISNVEDGLSKLSKIPGSAQDQILDIFNASEDNMDKIQSFSKKNINKIYTSAGDIIEIPEENLKKIFSFSKNNIRFLYAFLSATLFKAIKKFYKAGFKTELNKDKALDKKKKSKTKDIVNVNIFNKF